MSEPSFLPFPTDLIPAEEGSGNLDPLGTLTHAEYLAEALLPGLTVRTWRGEAVSELMPWLSADAGKSKQMVTVPILHVFCGNRSSSNDETAMEPLPRSCILASFSQTRMQYLDQEGAVVSTSKDGATTKSFPALEWLAAMCSHGRRFKLDIP